MSDTQGNQSAEEKTATPIPSDAKPAEAEEPKLPDGASERTQAQFDKLKEHNAQLKAEVEAYKSKTSVLDELRPSQDQAIAQEAQPAFSQGKESDSRVIDENGYVDMQAFERKLAKAEEAARLAAEQAKKAEERAKQVESRIQWQEETEQVKIAHASFPHLDPKSESFDPKFYELVRNELIGQMMRGEKNLVEAAKKVSNFYSPPVDVSKEKQEAVDEYKKKSTKRDNASESSERSVKQVDDREELSRKTREGDMDALYKRLQAGGY